MRKAQMILLRAAATLALLVPGAGPVLSDTAGQRGGGFALTGGEAIYRGVCQGCHMADAKGAVGAGAYPALTGNAHLASANYVEHIVLKGQKGMPAFGDNLTDQQIADVVNFIRSHFGNRFTDEVKPANVQGMR